MSATGHQRRFDIDGTSAIAPIATKMSDRDERRKGAMLMIIVLKSPAVRFLPLPSR
jgi:hypothetical protein